MKRASGSPIATLSFCAIAAALSVVSLLQTRLDLGWRALHSSDAFRSPDFWRLVLPATMLHSSWHHFLPNLAVALFLGTAMERRVGSLRFLPFVLLCSIVPTGLELWASGRPQIGISGVDYALLGFLLPNPPGIRRSVWLLLATILLAWLVVGLVFPISPENPPGNVSHFSGLALGLLTGLIFRARVQQS